MTTRGAPTCLQPSWVSPPRAVPRSPGTLSGRTSHRPTDLRPARRHRGDRSGSPHPSRLLVRGGTVVRGEAAFEEFVRGRGAALLRFAYLLTGDRGHAEDLVQDALVKAYLRWNGRAVIEYPEAYVRRTIVNQFVSWRRRRSSGEVVGPVPELSGGDHAQRLTERVRVWKVLSELPPRQRSVLVLRYYEG